MLFAAAADALRLCPAAPPRAKGRSDTTPTDRCLTFVMPYMVVGRMMVSSGVLCRGVLRPKTAIVLGAYTARSCAAASSRTFWMPWVLTCTHTHRGPHG